jgi:hypothetical protein
MNLAPGIQRQIERVLMLADKPLLRRPIAAAVVLDALPKACEIDADLCAEVRQYLQRYMSTGGVTGLQLGVAVASGDSQHTLANQHGLPVDSPWQISAGGYYQPSDYLLMTVGAIAYDGNVTPTGSVVSAGFDWAQLDIGYRDHWFSPLTDSSMLISSQAPTMPSITVSNYQPISRLGFSYEIFLAQMSSQQGIRYFNSTTAGHPRLAGLQLGLEPASGYSLAINRVMQYGGGARGGGGLAQLREALFTNSNRPDVQGQQQEFGNQVASLTSSIVFPGATPFAVRVEYAGEDNAYAGHYRLGDTDLSLGLDFPQLWSDFDLTYEVSEWQPVWYTHHIYPDGLTSHGHVIGHWFGDERQFNDGLIGGHSQMLRVGWRRKSGDYLQATYRNLAYDSNWVPAGQAAIPYQPMHELGLSYTTMWHGHAVGADVYVGRDVFGESFARVAATVDVAAAASRGAASRMVDTLPTGTELFVDVGMHNSTVRKILADYIPDFSIPAEKNYHLGFGARRPVSEHSDLGIRLELDRVDGNDLLSLRALDYRYRVNRKLAVSGFFGAARYDVGLPAYGYYWGGGLQIMNLMSKWDLGLDLRHHEKLGRDKVLSTDPPPTPIRTRLFFDINGTALYLSRRF